MKTHLIIISIIFTLVISKSFGAGCPANKTDFENGGTFCGNCNLTGPVQIQSGATVTWQDGTLSVNGGFGGQGTFILEANGVVNTTAGFGSGANGNLIINGTVNVGGALIIGGTASLTGNGYITYGTSNINGTTNDNFSDCDNGDGDCGDPTLPVELLQFTSEKYNDGALLYWSTASEVNNKGFQVEQSYDAENWEAIGFVEGNGTVNSMKEYQFDVSQLLSDSYFRLKQIDYDGQFEYSPVIFHESDALTERISFYPNSVSHSATLVGPSEHEFSFLLTDFSGNVLMDYDLINLDDAEIALNNMLPFMKTGIYIIKVSTAYDQYAMRMIKN